MNLIISSASKTPIYEQIMNQIKQKIASGELAPGDMLPSIRTLAKDLRISVITTKRAYDELEHQGLVTTVAGKGCFIANRNREWIREDVLCQIEGHMQEIVHLAEQIGVRGEGLRDMFDALISALMEEEP